jgi:ribonuclease VapC
VIVDSSALIAIVQGEPEATVFARLLLDGPSRMSVASWLEASLVVDSRSATHQQEFAEAIDTLGVELVPVTAEQAQAARAAHRRFGRGSGSPARLNYGDCFAYALARVSGEPLLFKGDDFGHTDVTAAAPA